LKISFSKKDSIGDVELDTAIMYCGGNTEKILGKFSGNIYGVEKLFLGNVPAWKKENIPMATKVNPWGGKGLGRESVFKQFETSLTNMKVDKGEDSNRFLIGQPMRW